MITTFTLNPCIDRMLYLDNFRENAVNRVSHVKTYPGGKGINVGRILGLIGAKALISGIVAGTNGEYIVSSLKKTGLEADFLVTDGETRMNSKIYDTHNFTTTDINEPGPTISRTCRVKLIEKVKNLSYFSNTVVFAGSLPPGLDPGFYRELIEISRSQGCNVVLDCDAESLKEGIKAGPTLIKPNVHELEMLFSSPMETIDEIGKAARSLLKEGILHVVVSMGGKGVCLFSGGRALHAEAVPVEVKGTVGAGDSMVAVFAHALDSGLPPEELLPLAVSASAACVHAGGTGELDRESLFRYTDRVKIRELSF